MTRRAETRGEHAVRWIEMYCLVPDGPRRQQRVSLTAAERSLIYTIYEAPRGPRTDVRVDGHLAAFLALLHLCGFAALDQTFRPALETNVFAAWDAASTHLRAVLRFDLDGITCGALGTTFKAVAQMPVALTDKQLVLVMDATRRLEPERRDLYLRRCAAKLVGVYDDAAVAQIAQCALVGLVPEASAA